MSGVVQGIKVLVLLLTVVLCVSMLAEVNAEEAVKCKTCNKVIGDDLKKLSVIQREVSSPVSFDDIGCAMIYREEQCSSRQMVFDSSTKVFDYNDGAELAVDAAYYVRSEAVKSPAGHNFAAFKDEASAETFLKEHGGDKVLSYDDLQVLEWKK